MGLIFNQLFQFIKLLNSETGTTQISWGIAMGFVLGMTPAFSLQTLLVFFLVFFLRIQLGAALISAFFFKFIAFLLDPLFHSAGSWVLSLSSLQALWVKLYNMPIIPYTRFNNSIVMGSGVVGFALLPFVYLGARYLVTQYRDTVVARFQNSKFFKAIRATTIYKWYSKYDQLYNS